MNKEEVLKKSQSKKRNKSNEMEMDILLKSHHIGLIAGLILCLIIVSIKIYLKQSHQDILSVFCSILCGQYLYKGIRLKNVLQMILGVIWGIMSLAWVIEYFMYCLSLLT